MSFRLFRWILGPGRGLISLMDILTDILQSAGLSKSLLTKQSFYKPWSATFPCDLSMGFHVVTQGEAFIRSSKLKTPLHLKRGDIAMLKRGFAHEISTGPEVKSKSATKTPLVTLVSGVYQFQTLPIHPLFSEIPDFLVIRSEEAASHSPLSVAQQLLSAELDQTGPGSEAITKSLLDVLFHYIFRMWLLYINKNTGRWSWALKDQHLQRAIGAIHTEPTRDWNLEDLADVAGISRAAFAQKFKKITGETPAHYVTKVRIQRAMDLLRSTDTSLEGIAEKVGYGDSFVFSKAFKRVLGLSPRDFRNQANEVNQGGLPVTKSARS
jgi:AraC-like DNA-binding protein